MILTGMLLLPAAQAEVLVQGAAFHGTNGPMFDPDGRLAVASVFERSVLVLDPETGALIERFGPSVGVETPDDVAFGPDGSLYWTAIVTGEVGRLDPDGVKTGQMIAPGVNPITFSDDGRLFVALDFYGDGLYELDPDLVEPPRLIIETLGWLNGMDWGPDDLLYGPIWTLAQVVKIDVDTAELTVVAEDFGTPAAVKFDSQGRLHVLDTGRGEVVRVDTATGEKEVVASVPIGSDNLAFDDEDRLFVTGAVDGYVVEAMEDDTLRTVSRGGMILPMGVAVTGRADGESVWVADYFSLREFDGETGAELSKTISLLGVGTSIPAPVTVAPHGDDIVITSFFDNEVAVWDPVSGEVVAELHDFIVPMNAISFEGDLIIAELGATAGAARVVRVRADVIEVLADATVGLLVPTGLAATATELWVADWATGSIIQLVGAGVPPDAPAAVVAGGLSFPAGLAVDDEGQLFTIEMGTATLARIDPATGRVVRVAAGLQVQQDVPAFLPPTGFLPGVAVGPSGAVYATGTAGNLLYRFTPEELYDCTADATTLCLNQGRFAVSVGWEDFEGRTGVGQAHALTDDTGAFWFFDEENLELMVKVLDGRAINGHYWVFYGSLTNVEFELTVRYTETGEVKTYTNPSEVFASTGDTMAFAVP
jgi:sugar lactone lactonase YvrE